MNRNIAIDGPMGAGKSTVAREVARRLGMTYLDTGAMYRAVGLKALRLGFDTKADKPKIIEMMLETSVELNEGGGCILDGEEVTPLIRTPEVSTAASDVSAIPEVKKQLIKLQQQLAEKESVVMDGRDIASHVLPNAEVKIFLTASVEERAKRRYDELVQKGMKVEYADVEADLRQRDLNDSTREFAPLKPADGAVLIDTTGNTLEQSVAILTNTVKEILN